VLGTGTLSGGSATLSTATLSARVEVITVVYAGDATFATSSGTVTQKVNKEPTTTTLTSGPNPYSVGQMVTFAATVNSSGSHGTHGDHVFQTGRDYAGNWNSIRAEVPSASQRSRRDRTRLQRPMTEARILRTAHPVEELPYLHASSCAFRTLTGGSRKYRGLWSLGLIFWDIFRVASCPQFCFGRGAANA